MKTKKCVICTLRKGKRFCVKEDDFICSKCCGLIRDPQLCPNDCQYLFSATISKKEFGKLVAMQLDYCADANLNECKEIIKRGILIAETLGLRIPREFREFKYILGDLDTVEVTGSLYKCFECGKGDLPDEIVEQIKEVTLHDVAAGVCGTEDETMLYSVCDKCKGEEGE